MKHETTDFYLTATFMALGYDLLEIVPQGQKKFSFTLNVTPKKANDISLEYWKRSLSIPIRNFVEALNELKTRMYAKN